MAKYYSVTMAIDDNGLCGKMTTAEVEANSRPESIEKELPRKTIYVDYFDSYEEAEQFIKENQS